MVEPLASENVVEVASRYAIYLEAADQLPSAELVRAVLAEIGRLRNALQMIADNTICPEAFPDEANGDRLSAKSAMLIAICALEGHVGGGGDEPESDDG